MHANGESCSGKRQGLTQEKGNGLAVSFKYLWKVYEIMRRSEVAKNYQSEIIKIWPKTSE
jgi:hypothetical protein